MNPSDTKIDLACKGDKEGLLIALDRNILKFDIKRVYYIFGTDKNVTRGNHAHIKLRQFAVCITGSCTMVLDDGRKRIEIRMDSPAKGVYINPMIWHEMHSFSEDCVLLVIADDYYLESDYIRSYDAFKGLVK